MIPLAAFLLGGVSAGLNRKWRGEGQAPRWVWYSFMTIIAYVVTGDLYFTGIWLFFLLGYALLAWQAMFSAVNGNAPGRKDAWYEQWMQTLALKIAGTPNLNFNVEKYWYKYGRIYGAIRSITMLPAVLMFCGYLHSPWPLIGLLFVFMGWIYYLCGCFAAYNKIDRGAGVPFAEITMGWAVLTYMLILASVAAAASCL